MFTETDEHLSGTSGHTLIGTLRRLASVFGEKDTCYLEVGVFQGLALLSVAGACPNLPCYGIDNFDPESRDFRKVKGRIKKRGVRNVTVINNDYEVTVEDLEPEHRR